MGLAHLPRGRMLGLSVFGGIKKQSSTLAQTRQIHHVEDGVPRAPLDVREVVLTGYPRRSYRHRDAVRGHRTYRDDGVDLVVDGLSTRRARHRAHNGRDALGDRPTGA